jgi:hypothetical protein
MTRDRLARKRKRTENNNFTRKNFLSLLDSVCSLLPLSPTYTLYDTMRSTFPFSTYSPWSSTAYGFSSPTFSDVSSESTPQITPVLDSLQDQRARGYGSSVLGGEVYCPHLVKERRYEPPGTPIDFDLKRQPSSYSPGGWSTSSRSEPELCDHCESVSPSVPSCD